MALEFSRDGFFGEGKEVATLFLAGRDRRPHAFVIPLADGAAGALRDSTVNHAVTNLLFAMIVRRFHPFDEHESEVVLRQIVLPRLRGFRVDVLHDREPRSQVRGLFRRPGKRRSAHQIERSR